MTTISNLFSNGSATPIVKGKKAYEPTTAGAMASSIAERIGIAIQALEDFERPTFLKDAEFNAPMVKPVRNGYFAKIGLGKKNEAIDKDFSFYTENKETMMVNLENLKEAFELGHFDDLLEAKLESYRERAAKGKEARKNNNILEPVLVSAGIERPNPTPATCPNQAWRNRTELIFQLPVSSLTSQ